MKICMINPIGFDVYYEGCEYTSRTFNSIQLGIGYIAAVLEEHGHQVDIFECLAQRISSKEVLEKVREEKYDVIGLSSYYYNYTSTLRMLMSLRKQNKAVFIFAGGYYPTTSTIDALNKLRGVDCCVLGEGEYIVLELVEALANKKDWRKIKGIAYLEGKEAVINKNTSLIKNLDKLPFPKRVTQGPKGWTNMISSRGCYGFCSFCGVRDFYSQCDGAIARYRSCQNVVDELEILVKEKNVKHISFVDDNFAAGSQSRTKWLDEFCQEVKKRNLKFTFDINARANDIENHPENMDKLKEIGLISVLIGVESFVQRQLDFYNKKVKAESNIVAMKKLSELNLDIYMGFIMFEPHVDLDDILYNIRIIKELAFYKHSSILQPPISCMPPLYPIPGTPFQRYLEENQMFVYDGKWAYHFENEEIELMLQILDEWASEINYFFNNYYLISKARKHGKEEIANQLIEVKEKTMRIDIDFIEMIASGLKNGTIIDENYKEVVVEWMKKITPYRLIVDDLKNLL